MSCLSRGQRKYEATEYTGSDPIFPDIAQVLLHIGPVDHDLRTGHVRCIERNIRQNLFP